jgi:arylsulfatase A-like enzyme/Tfp pilus assembly protein PilF
MDSKAFAALVCIVVAGCGASADEPVANVILVTLDTTRADVLSCYGGSTEATPVLGALARESLVFDAARAVAPLTAPSHASMLTGLVPPRHAVRDNGIARLPAAATTLAERARAAGLSTAAFVSALVLDRSFGFDQGFDVYDQPPRPDEQTSSHYVERDAHATLAAATRWLEKRRADERFFLWIHLFDAHVPYQPPPDCLARAGGDPYRGEVAFVDRELGTFLDTLRARALLETSLLVVVGDHGESLGEHGEPTHSAFCYDATLRVPLLLRHPAGRRAGERSNAVVSVVDVFPTALAALGLGVAANEIASADALDGVDLFAPLDPERSVYCESYAGYLNYGWSPLAGVVDARHKYLASAEDELFDLAHDPREQKNRASAEPELVRGMRAALATWFGRPALAPEAFGATPEAIAELRKLGYAASGDARMVLPTPLEPTDRPAPAARAAELEPLLHANAALDGGDAAEAARLLAPILAANPRHALARDLAALAALSLGDFARAKELLLQRLALGLERADTRINLAIACERLGDDERAEREWRRAHELDPLNRQALTGLAALAERLGRTQEAAEWRARLQSSASPAPPRKP